MRRRRGPSGLLIGVIAGFVALALGVTLIVVAVTRPQPPVATHPSPTPSTDWTAYYAQLFDPGFIVSDDTFFDSSTMDGAAVQAFFTSVSCAPSDDVPCLASYAVATRNIPADPGRCAAYAGRPREKASSIIVKVARACGINPRVLIVLLQKEQSLLTAPSSYGYQRATGYFCPDGKPCNQKYFGFFNQVYKAAWQYREYATDDLPWQFEPGQEIVPYGIGAACGGAAVYIANQATADLYDYTPYQPSPAVLSNPHGPKDDCLNYGNLNFFALFSTWFGQPTVARSPYAEPGTLLPRGVGLGVLMRVAE